MPPLREAGYFLGLLAQIGLSMAVSIYIGYRLGSALDRALATDMVFTLVGSALGIGAGFLASYRMIMISIERSKH